MDKQLNDTEIFKSNEQNASNVQETNSFVSMDNYLLENKIAEY